MKTLSQLIPSDLILDSRLKPDCEVRRISQNSKDIQKGDLYFAIRGTKVDGHLFVADAIRSGASVVVEDRAIFQSTQNAVFVHSAREALAFAVSRWYDVPSAKMHVVGITGTNGKTTAVYLLQAIWNALKCPNGTIGTVQAMIGDEAIPSQLTTPGAIELQELFSRMVEKKLTHVAMEVTSIALDQFRTAGTHFEVGIFTNLTQDHLDYHGSFESYRDAKLKFFRDYPLKCAVINIDDPAGKFYYERTTAKTRLSYSLLDPKADFFILSSNFSKRGTTAKIRTPQGELALRVSLIGRHNLYNCLGVLAATYALGLDLEKAATALASTQGAPGRLERVLTDERIPNVFVDYAHTDDALYNVLVSLTDLKKGADGRVITVFGCGGDRDRTKRPKMASVVSRFSDITIATSDNPRTEDPGKIIDEMEPGIDKSRTQYFREVNRKKAIHLALEMAKPEDLVLIAGKGHEDYQIIGTEKFPFDDSRVIRDYYSQCTPG